MNTKKLILFALILGTVYQQSCAITIDKLVIPAAGFGTRFLPFTKTVSKEMLPILNTPAFEFIIVEGLDSGINQFYTIVNDNKQEIKDYFSHLPQLENMLEERDKAYLIKNVNTIIDAGTYYYIPQPQQLGLGHAILMAKEAIGNDYFAVSLPDEIFFSEIPVLKQLIEIAQKYQAHVVAVREVPKEKVNRYAVITIKKELEQNVYEIDNIIEKPPPEEAQTNLATCGRYIFSPKLFESLESILPGHGGEIQLTDGIADLIKKGERVIAINIVGEQPHDIGNPFGWFEANVYYALKHPKYSSFAKEVCTKLLSQTK